MKWRFSSILFLLSMAVAGSGCVYDYEPKEITTKAAENSIVVIDGDIAVGSITTVSVNITQPLINEDETVLPLGASVWVEEEGGTIYSGVEKDGQTNVFEINTTQLSLQGRYRLGVSIPDRGEYLSEFREVLITPAIDSITRSIAPDNITAYVEVTTHKENAGAADTSRLYCKWNYEENWESPSVYAPSIEWNKKFQMVVELSEKEKGERHFCFSESVSSEVLIGNTEKLSENLIYKHIIAKIPNNDSRAKALYSIKVSQQSLDKGAYEYWEVMRRNSSNIGGLFSSQPTEIAGNIKNVSNPGEHVIGYVNVATVQTCRVFIDWGETDFYKSGCVMTKPPPGTDFVMIMNSYVSSGSRLVFRTDEDVLWGSTVECVDCRSYSNGARPEWWPNDKYGN